MSAPAGRRLPAWQLAGLRQPGRAKTIHRNGQPSLGDDAIAAKELITAQHEMPDLMACRTDFGQQPFKGMNINVSLHMTIQTGVLIATIAALGARVR